MPSVVKIATTEHSTSRKPMIRSTASRARKRGATLCRAQTSPPIATASTTTTSAAWAPPRSAL